MAKNGEGKNTAILKCFRNLSIGIGVIAVIGSRVSCF
jgi:hypothetical protein